ncbi:MAG: FKBP-type peptidyl-prolyl cis-trans isomerase [Alistipes sp.]|nr:FKBP-type peptidyl-prolyl cis-trans isomerase [Alistipes sp.]
MRRKIISGLVGVMMALSLAGCGGKTDTDKNAVVDYSDYITLCDYKNVEIEVTPLAEVTQEEIQREINSCLNAYAETNQITQGTVKNGDSINLDFSGLLDGVAFVGGTATDYSYTVGGAADGSKFIDDLDSQLVGLEIGKEYELPCKFPENYGNEELNGKDVIFVVTVNYVKETILPEYNDDFVKMMTENTDEVLNTTKELEDSIVEYLENDKKNTYENNVYGQMMITIIDQSEIKGVPENEFNETVETIKANVQAEFDQMGSYLGFSDLEGYLTGYYGYASMEAFEKEISDYSTEYMYEKMILSLVAQNEGITATQEEIDAYIEENAAYYGYESAEQFRTLVGETIDSEVEQIIVNNKAAEAIIGYAKIK